LIVVVMHFYVSYVFRIAININALSSNSAKMQDIGWFVGIIDLFVVFLTVSVSLVFFFITMRRLKEFFAADIEKYLLAIESSSNHIIITDSNGLILYANKGAEKMTGYTFQEMVGNTPRLWGALMSGEFYKNLWQTIKYDRNVFCGEVKNRRKNQEEYFTLAHISPMIDKYNNLIGFVATEEDITDHKQVEKELDDARVATRNILEDLQMERENLSQAKSRDDAILSSIGDGLIAVDRDGTIIMMNGVAENMFGCGSGEFLGKKFYEAFGSEDERGDLVPREKREFSVTLTVGKKNVVTSADAYYYIRKDGTRFPVAFTASPIIFNDQIIGAINIFRDIATEKELDRLKSEFVSLASHQLRTPLTGISWTVDLFLRKEKLPEKQRKYLKDIRLSADRLNILVELLLSISRIESGRVGVVPESVDLVEFIKNDLRGCSMLFEKKKLTSVFTNHPEKLIAIIDKSLFDYIFQNILSNAINYTPKGGMVEIVLKIKEDSALLVISDTGIGIPKEAQTRIFEKFFRASNAVMAKPDGTGLGLYIAREAVKLLGGKIWYESNEGGGAVFYVEFPLAVKSLQGKVGLIPLKMFAHK